MPYAASAALKSTHTKKESSVAISCSIGHRHGLDPALLWLWCRLAAAAPIQPLAWELPYATSVALQRQKKKNQKIKSPRCSVRENSSSFQSLRKDTGFWWHTALSNCAIWIQFRFGHRAHFFANAVSSAHSKLENAWWGLFYLADQRSFKHITQRAQNKAHVSHAPVT